MSVCVCVFLLGVLARCVTKDGYKIVMDESSIMCKKL